jgi:hypothetical protein
MVSPPRFTGSRDTVPSAESTELTAIVENSVSQHHHQSAWQRTELPQVYGDTVMLDMDWAMGASGFTGVREMDGVMGVIY